MTVRSIKIAAMTVVAFLFAFAGAAWASSGGAADPSIWEIVQPVIDAVLGGQYFYAAALGLVLLVAVAKTYGPSWAQSGAVAALMVLTGAFGASLAAALADGSAPSWPMAWVALQLAVSASGAYALARAILTPLIGRLPAWAQGPLRWVLSRPIDTAEAAGDAAVASNPGAGVSGVVGVPRDIR